MSKFSLHVGWRVDGAMLTVESISKLRNMWGRVSTGEAAAQSLFWVTLVVQPISLCLRFPSVHQLEWMLFK